MLSDQLLGKDKELATKTAANLGAAGEQAEWFLLAISSYKMKKYGECLFAVSKTARRSTVANQVAIDISDQASNGDIAISGISEDGTATPNDPDKNFDEQGNLNHRGKIFISYLKAKCLCKLKRYSESLFTLARITSTESYVHELSERQCLKVILYKGVDLFYIKQYMEAVLTINGLL